MKNLLFLFLVIFAVSCDRQADIVSRNISVDAGEFQIYRRVVFYNGITDAYILQVEGFCSVSTEDGRLAVTIKTEDGTYLKHYLGLSDNVTYFAEQLKPSQVSNKNYKVIFRPTVIIPTVEIK